eukprot:TRINITY_DN2624_c0_g2_i2.p1 TRINITY_DN2624_c0_g2~~TRINITY_DN2624_c0_g2_i2.p1  ORF type:complete len:288 (+),score=77.90 TRINITY_DN2624_c0_g2_i2:464-1327(+)
MEDVLQNNIEIGTIPKCTQGTIYQKQFLKLIEPLYTISFGVENMAPLLYSLIRFLKPKKVLEVGCGYTSVFILQALKDNDEELCNYQHLYDHKKSIIEGTPFLVSSFFEHKTEKESKDSPPQDQEELALQEETQDTPQEDSHFQGILHCVDNLEHQQTTANKVLSVVEKLNLFDYLEFHVADAFQFSEQDQTHPFDFLWLDFGAGKRIGEFFEKWWDRLRPGGYVLVHSTLTNKLTRQWIEQMRTDKEAFMRMDMACFLEPHKTFQNSFSLFQKRGDYIEPIYSLYP